MSVYIKGMEMPTSCFYCPFREKVNPDDYVCMALNKEFEETFSLIAGKRYKNCPLIPVPEHGRLIDADALESVCVEQETDNYCKQHQPRNWARAFECFEMYVSDAPTIIPASGGNENE